MSSDSESSDDELVDLCSFAPAKATAEASAKSSKKRKLEASIAATHQSAHSLEKEYKEAPAPAPAAAASPRAAPEAARERPAEEAARLQSELAADYPGAHQPPRAYRNRDKKLGLAPGKTKRGGKESFNSKEKRSRTKRGDNDYVQEEKRILRQATDGYGLGY